jgi:hypothetical protein
MQRIYKFMSSYRIIITSLRLRVVKKLSLENVRTQ